MVEVAGSDPLRPGDLISVRDVIDLLPFSRATVYRLLKEGAIRNVRVKTAACPRGKIVIRRKDVDDFMEKQTGASTSAPAGAKMTFDELAETIRRE